MILPHVILSVHARASVDACVCICVYSQLGFALCKWVLSSPDFHACGKLWSFCPMRKGESVIV